MKPKVFLIQAGAMLMRKPNPLSSLRPPRRASLMLPAMAPALVLAVLFSGCGQPARIVPTLDIPGFEGLREDLGAVDTSPLRGRRILLDPGHGGMFRGALGPNGLAEADVNLGVALYLRGMLEWAGAEVFMTRTSDHDFLAGTDSTLAADLAFRVFLADSLQPDVFLSIHHNSNPSYDPVINETQTYYPLGDQGVSRELAQAIHRHLAVNLEITPARLLPGNFHVLRNVSVPAVLGEPAMISNPVMAGRLSLAESHRLEAAAYFLGLREYFAGGSPRWSGAQSDTVRVPPRGPSPLLNWTFIPDDRPWDAPGPDPASFILLENGKSVPFALSADGRTVSWRTDPSDRPVLLELRGRNLQGRSMPVRRTLVQPEGSPAPRVKMVRETDPQGGAVLVDWESPGGSALPAGRLLWSGGFALEISPGASGSALVTQPGAFAAGESVDWAASDSPARSPCPSTEEFLPPPWRWRRLVLPDGSAPGLAAWRPRLGPPAPVCEARAVAVVPDLPLWLEAPGFLPLVDPAPGDSLAVRTVAAGERTWVLQPVLPRLASLTIILDPRGGGTVTDGVTSLGQRGADLNLETARQAELALRGAGANVVLARGGDSAPEDPDKVLLARRSGADLYLVIGRSSPGGRFAVRHYPGSPSGTAWAAAMAAALDPLTEAQDSVVVGSGSDYLLRHTHCPALVVELPSPATPAQEIALASPHRARDEASALLIGIAGFLTGPDADIQTAEPAAVIGGIPGAIPLAEVDHAVWDGNFLWAPRHGGGAGGGTLAENSLPSRSATRWPAFGRRHLLEIQGSGGWQLWHLERTDRSGWQARLMKAGS